LSVQIEVLRAEPECAAYLLDFVDEPVDLPERGFFGLIAVKRVG
jgi:hypothetical protein